MSAPMSGHGLNTTLSTMDSAANHVDDVNREIAGLLSRVRGSVQQLGGGVWQGSAQVAFANVMTNWDDESRRLANALDAIGEQLRGNRRAFDASEQDNMAAINRVGAAGPLNI